MSQDSTAILSDGKRTASYKISVVIPAYNSGRTIRRAIQSVLNQTRSADEVIIVDDGSSDDTAEQAAVFGEQMRLIRQPNRGASVARNAGITTATGNWIAFLDADDEWVPEKLRLQEEHLKRHPDLVWTMSNYYTCRCDHDHEQVVYDQGRSAALLNGKDCYDNYFDSYQNGVCGNTNTMLIQKQTLLDAGLFRPGQLRMNDEDMWFRIAYRHPKVGYMRRPLAVYHRGVLNSIVKKHTMPELVIDFIHRHLKLAQEHGCSDTFRPVARAITKMWIHRSWEDERAYKIRLILRELGFLLPTGYKMAVYLLTVFPGLTLRCMPMLRKLNKWLKLPL